ncbi:hypothetical protein CBF23_011660 [Marinomonas agarivorans]|nr:hypothetical protein CBF23_011660 [Marinomonas agarivorans]
MNEKNLCDQLADVMDCIESVIASIGETPSNYKGFGTIKNIAKNKDKNGFKNITFYLNNEGRMLYDNGVYSDDLDTEMEKAYLIVEQLVPTPDG